MAWIELSIEIEGGQVHAAESALLDAGALSITLSDALDDPVLEPAPGSAPLWEYVRVTGLFPGDANREHLQLQLMGVLGDIAGSVRVQGLAAQDWNRAWRGRLQPARFGKSLWVVPGGQALPAGADDGVCVRLTPGLAFGTGTHATTALCLDWLDAHPPTDATVIDYGSGSGILAIAAAKLGAKSVLCVDHDRQARTATTANAEANEVSACVSVTGPEALPRGQCDLILANIVLNPLRELAPAFARWLRPAGRVVLSGILESQEGALARAYQERFSGFDVARRSGWSRLSAHKKAAREDG